VQENNGTTVHQFDENLVLKETTLPSVTSQTTFPIETVFTYEYNPKGEVTTSSNGETVKQYTYTQDGLVTSIKTDGVLQSSYTWQGVDLLSVNDALGIPLATYTYSNSSLPHLPTSSTDAEGNTWEYNYNSFGQLTQIVPPPSSQIKPTTYSYYENASNLRNYGLLKTVTNGAGEEAKITNYTRYGLPRGVITYPNETESNKTRTFFDSDGRLTKIKHPDDTTRKYKYTGKNLATATDEAGVKTRFEYCPSCGKLTKLINPLGQTYEWLLDSDFKTIGFIDGRGNKTDYDYKSELLEDRTYPDGTNINLRYDKFRKLDKVDNEDGSTTNYGIDDRLRVTSLFNPTVGGYSYSYRDDNLLDSVFWGNTTNYTYYPDKQLQQVEYNYQNVLTIGRQYVDATYYPDNLLHTLTWKNGSTVVASWEYTYDGSGKPKTITNNFGETTTFTYDGEGKLISQVNGNGTELNLQYQENRNFLTGITWSSSGVPFANYQNQYDNTVGNIVGTTETVTGETVSYTYDELYRLTGETRGDGVTTSFSENYTYDKDNNLTEINNTSFAEYDVGNNITALLGGAVDISYNGAGNTTSVDTDDFTYNGYNQLVTANNGDVAFLYSPTDGLRKIRKSASNPSSDTAFIYWNGKLIGEISPNGRKVAYTWGVNGIISQRDVTTSISHWHHHGALANIRHLTDSTGAVTDSYTYSAYGELLSQIGATENRYRYSGKVGCYTDSLRFDNVLCGVR